MNPAEKKDSVFFTRFLLNCTFMTSIVEFKASLKQAAPPAQSSVYLQALWYDATGNWNAAHNLVDSLNDKTACWVHAYLHRKEGDIWNADYWYRKAGKVRPAESLEEEWSSLVEALL
jgi:hypothetical protein